MKIDGNTALTTILGNGSIGIGFSETFDVDVGIVCVGNGKARSVVGAGGDFPVGFGRAGGEVSADAGDLTGWNAKAKMQL